MIINPTYFILNLQKLRKPLVFILILWYNGYRRKAVFSGWYH